MKVCIAVPCLDFIRAETVATLISLTRNYPELISKTIIKQRCLIHLSREALVKEAMQTDATHILFIDSDMCFSAQVLERLLSRDKDIVGALCYGRSFPLTPIVGKMVDGVLIKYRKDEIPEELFECDMLGTGCLMIKLSVFEKIKEPWFFYKHDENGGMGEDVWFCKKAKEAGFKIFCDPTMKIGHIGNYIYQ